MSKKSLIGSSVEDFLDQLPERMEMTEINPAVLAVPADGDEVICKASKATQKTLLQLGATMKLVERELVRVSKGDSKQEERDFLQDLEQNLAPLAQTLKERADLQMNLDLLAAGAERHSHQHLFVDRNLNVIRVGCAAALHRTLQMLTSDLPEGLI